MGILGKVGILGEVEGVDGGFFKICIGGHGCDFLAAELDGAWGIGYFCRMGFDVVWGGLPVFFHEVVAILVEDAMVLGVVKLAVNLEGCIGFFF